MLGDLLQNAQCEAPKSARSDSILENLKSQKAQAEDRLSRLNAAIEALEEHPETAKVLELVAKARY